ncbi:MAG: EamA family transporter [Vicinamibacterales bacterium]
MSPGAARQRKLAYCAWAAVCVIWGTTYFGIRISLETMPPFLMGGLRWMLAGGLLTLWLVIRGEALPPRSRWGSITLLGFLMLVLGNGGVVFAEQWVPSGLTAVLVATSPFWMAAIETFMPDGEKLRSRVIAGLVLGFSGIVLLVWPELTFGSAGHRGFLAGVIAVQIAAFGWSLGSSYSKRLDIKENILGQSALQMLFGGILMTIAGTLHGEWGSLAFSTRSFTALMYLSTIGALGGFVAYTYALRHLPVSFVSLYAYINPIIAVTLGVLFLNEPFTSRMAVSAGLVFAGVAVVRWARGSSHTARTATTHDGTARSRRQIA